MVFYLTVEYYYQTFMIHMINVKLYTIVLYYCLYLPNVDYHFFVKLVSCNIACSFCLDLSLNGGGSQSAFGFGEGQGSLRTRSCGKSNAMQIRYFLLIISSTFYLFTKFNKFRNILLIKLVLSDLYARIEFN